MTNKINDKLLSHLKKAIKEKKNFPIGILVHFGPDSETITKTVAVVVQRKNATLSIKSWNTPDISSNPKIAKDIGNYFKQNLVEEILMTDGVAGCPHDEGVDYPRGSDCPHCPYWSETEE
jgi:hypothetical protein